MRETLNIIPLRLIRHNERANILTAYSLERGRLAFAVPAGSGKSASRLRALLMPMSIVECETEFKPGRDILIMSNVRPAVTLSDIHLSPAKSAIALFLAETLAAVLRDGPPDSPLWHFIADSVITLNLIPARQASNFHLCFLWHLGNILGIAPDTSTHAPGRIFDMVDGIFRTSPPLHSQYLAPADAEAIPILDRLNYRTMHLWQLTRSQRNHILDLILEYFTLHLAPLTGLKSLAVLRAL